jgi:hypothetical protein
MDRWPFPRNMIEGKLRILETITNVDDGHLVIS